ncbi:oligopeptide transport system permease protein AppB [Citreicella sp. SE45]|uniref:Peptide/nickel transport system permease protein n=1 Tax=Salipiger thiooxidans TaxID=282683 RepID=A0A1G7FHX2_9RHOB|nr:MULTISPECIES: ABC transporter permease [Salipiger]EEX11780.1 oligopeptide transport system permease protein AppB [Citreicella sp. SE45]MAU48412.1 ABC transporter permease [Salipiger sp.]NVK59316.1 ABC transporter permease [Paracoccaceae bacterium]NIY94704.1 ABC transporter permease [Salipiger sp. HF18]SDE75534.1 peptide/nickel transport system permease protein [Salipiger thiooxidans]
MIRFLTHRTLQGIVLILIVSMIGFTVINLAPGGPLSQYAMTPGMSQQDLDRIAHQMGLDRPIPVQYLDWLVNMVSGDWGKSYRDQSPVLDVVWRHMWATLLLMGTSTAIAVALGTLIGVLGALKRYSVFDYMATVGAMIALSIPTFWFGLVAIFFFSLELGWLPAGNMYTVGDQSFSDYAIHLIMPSIVLALVNVAIWSRYMRASTLDVMDQDYVRTARAKGLPRWRIVSAHIVRNALIPMITLAGLQLPTIIGGALVTETVFTWPGLGRLFIDSLGYNDYPVIMGLLMFSAILTVIGNFLADIGVALADPRIRLG